MNATEDVVVGWGEPLEEGEEIRLEDLVSKIGGEPVELGLTQVMAHRRLDRRYS